jgi:hypothetical protein
MTSIYVTSFGFVGVEAVAATAQEAKLEPLQDSEDNNVLTQNGPDLEMNLFVSATPRRELQGNSLNTDTGGQGYPPFGPVRHMNGSIGSAGSHQPTPLKATAGKADIFRRPAMLIPLVATFIYIWGGWSVTQDIDYNDPNLPSLLWNSTEGASIFVDVAANYADSGNQTNGTSALTSNMDGQPLAKSLTALLIVNVFSTSSTALYIASRTLYGMAYTIQKNKETSRLWWVDVARVMSRKNKFDVPWVSVLMSAWLFWLPFVRYNANASIVSRSKGDVIPCWLIQQSRR